MTNVITTAAAALALEESMYSCTADLTPFWAVQLPCDCEQCNTLVWRYGRTLPTDGTCLGQKEHDEIRWDRDLRWELVAILEEEERYAYWRCFERYEREAEYDAADAAAAAKEAIIAGFMAAA